jgi:hypothetical protein
MFLQVYSEVFSQMEKLNLNYESLQDRPATTRGFAILGQKQYPSALVRYWASVWAEVFQCSFLFLSSVFQPACRQAGWAAIPGGKISNSPTSPIATVIRQLIYTSHILTVFIEFFTLKLVS